ncbi:uncharacterized protein LOC131006921 [Salvia miltiorrhiza]|uniref:uncharacterized protein LOC131006921 n=1 Tax=Salvia miltiorrhiza TaxID=226208 RepID=UPI0025AD7A41|nr:uncharacterized protein LOC131006921 [Salvia miltiorrhiza]
MASSRQPNYTIDEDKHLCRVYLEISQDSETGIQQRKENFWDRIREVYNEEKPNPNMYTRSSRSLETRMHVILSSVSKLKGCIQQVEYLNPSGCSESDIFTRAKELMMLDTKYKKCFKFEHVWSIMKDYQKFDCPSQNSRQQMSASQSDSLPQSPISPDGLSNFSINLSDGSGSGSGSSHRPDGVKKTKNKRKKGEDMSNFLKVIEQGNKRIGDLMENSSTTKEQILQLQMQKIEAKNKATEAKKQAIAFQMWESDNKILMMDTDNISEPVRRDYFKSEQAKIIFKRQQHSSPYDAFNMFGGNFHDFGGSGSDIGGSGSDVGGSGSDLGPY